MNSYTASDSTKQITRTLPSIRQIPAFRYGVRSLAMLAMIAISTTLLACQVPVFRYGLERWNADRYQVIVLHESPLTAPQAKAMASLKTYAENNPGQQSMVNIQTIDVAVDSKQVSASMRQAWAEHADKSTPLMLVHYPIGNQIGREAHMFQARLTEENVQSLFKSPLRDKLAQRLSQGDSAVWIFVPCGRKDEDQAALKRLKDQLAADASWLKLPSAKELEVEPEILETAKVPLKIQYSTLTLRRDDPAEKFLLQSLLHSEDDLLEFDEPLAFPVFGRGRVLYALVGKGISSETVRSTSTFLTGPCSCQVKNQNPGFDMLLPVDWDKVIGDVLISEPIESVDKEANAPKLLTIPPGRNRSK